MPVCSRCAEKKIPCIYSKTKVASQPDKHNTEPTPYTEAISFGSPTHPLFALDMSLDLGYLGSLPMDSRPDTAAEPTHQSVMDASGSGDTSMDTLIDLIGNSSSPSPDQWLVRTDESLFTERPSTPADEEIVRAYQKMALFCVSQI